MNQASPHQLFAQNLDELLSRVQKSTTGSLSLHHFFRTALEDTIRTSSAVSLILWQIDGQKAVQLTTPAALAQMPVATDQLVQVCRGLQTQTWVEPVPNPAPKGPSSLRRYVVPLDLGHAMMLVIDAVYIADEPDDVILIRRRFLEKLGSLLGRQFLQATIDMQKKQVRLFEALSQCHLSRRNPQGNQQQLTRVAEAIRETVGCDRVFLWCAHANSRNQLASSTGVPIESQSSGVIQLQKLCSQLQATGKGLSYVKGQAAAEQEYPEALENYLPLSEAKALTFVPIQKNGTGAIQGYVILERFQESTPLTGVEVLPSIQPALVHVMDQWAGQATNFWSSGTHSRARLGWIMATVAIVALLFLALFPMEMIVTAEGKIQPVRQQEIFAPTTGIVSQLLVKHGAPVEQGDLLVEVVNLELNLEQEKLDGELLTLTSQLNSLKSRRIQINSRRNPNETDSDQQLSIEQAVAEEKIKLLGELIKMIKREKETFKIRSPIKGRVNLQEQELSLESRPVAQGQYLMEIDSLENGWELQLQIPDHDSGYVAQQLQQNHKCELRYQIRSQPLSDYTAELTAMDHVTTPHPQGGVFVRSHVPIQTEIESIYSGASVIARIKCQKHPAGYVLFRDLIEFVHTHLPF